MNKAMSDQKAVQEWATQAVSHVIARAKNRVVEPIARSIASAISAEIELSEAKAPAAPVSYPEIDYPTLEERHVAGARLFSSRENLINALNISEGGVVAEVGVAFGDFSDFLIRATSPRRFVAIDIFQLHHIPVIWGRQSATWFQGKTHRQYFEDRFSSLPGVDMTIIEGDGAKSLLSFPDRTFDLIYIDAGHEYGDVSRDAHVAKEKIVPQGVLVFNDYTMSDHVTRSPYGIVPAVNSLVVEEDWRVVGFALQHDMFCDIAIRRSGD